MAKMSPFHSISPNNRKVHHDNLSCTEANNIESQNKRSGTGGYPLCSNCQRL